MTHAERLGLEKYLAMGTENDLHVFGQNVRELSREALIGLLVWQVEKQRADSAQFVHSFNSLAAFRAREAGPG